MHKVVTATVLLGLLAGCGSPALTSATLTPNGSSLGASATQEEQTAQRNVRRHAESQYPGLIITSLVARRDPDTGVDFFSLRGVGSYKGQHVGLHGAYILSQDRMTSFYILDDSGNSVIR